MQVRVNGEVEEVVVDDYVPVNELGEPLFCQPNRNEFWMLIPETGAFGVFYMGFNSFCEYFSHLHVCLLTPWPNYSNEPLFLKPHGNGSLY